VVEFVLTNINLETLALIPLIACPDFSATTISLYAMASHKVRLAIQLDHTLVLLLGFADMDCIVGPNLVMVILSA